ncbi:hypothetical protein CES85_0368 [Ochrobactrum quorumnocens]|uniref:Uncharacterized protein n=1 Tax=Ochrobactrum quorumnocens TaxID=271865 RepID=A0A248UHM9_9HYPH|nr:hypothetical protein CES85_0368 [[Ochrobactrum] quorumnocens]
MFLRISERKTGSHFCWKCFKPRPVRKLRTGYQRDAATKSDLRTM